MKKMMIAIAFALIGSLAFAGAYKTWEEMKFSIYMFDEHEVSFESTNGNLLTNGNGSIQQVQPDVWGSFSIANFNLTIKMHSAVENGFVTRMVVVNSENPIIFVVEIKDGQATGYWVIQFERR